MNRDEFYNRVRSAVSTGRAYRVNVDTEIVSTRVGYVGGGDDLPARLAAEIVAVGGDAIVVDDTAAARDVLATLLERYQPRSAVCWQHAALGRVGLDDLLAERHIKKLDHTSLAAAGATAREELLAADIGITGVSHAVAETGSLMMMARPGQERVASLIVPVHIAIVEREDIVPDLFDIFDGLAAMHDDLPSNIAFITGPSKTGDIEMTLTTGVHGPGKWHVIIVRQ